MARIQTASEILGLTQPPLREYEQQDFEKINKRLSCYWEKDGDKIRFNYRQFFIDCGGMTEDESIIVQNFRYEKNKHGDFVAKCDEPTRYKRAQHLASWYISNFLYRGLHEKSIEQPRLDEPF